MEEKLVINLIKTITWQSILVEGQHKMRAHLDPSYIPQEVRLHDSISTVKHSFSSVIAKTLNGLREHEILTCITVEMRPHTMIETMNQFGQFRQGCVSSMMLVIDIDARHFELTRNALVQADAEVSDLSAGMASGMQL